MGNYKSYNIYVSKKPQEVIFRKAKVRNEYVRLIRSGHASGDAVGNLKKRFHISETSIRNYLTEDPRLY